MIKKLHSVRALGSRGTASHTHSVRCVFSEVHAPGKNRLHLFSPFAVKIRGVVPSELPLCFQSTVIEPFFL